jgi:hypothetical protein
MLPGPVACGRGAAPLPLGHGLSTSRAPHDNPLSASCLRRDSPSCLYAFEVAARSDLRASLSSSGFDGALALFAAPPGAAPLPTRAAELACVDDSPLGDTQHAHLDLTLEPGTYTLAVVAPAALPGQFELFAEVEPLPALADVCAAAPAWREGSDERGSTRGGASSFGARCGNGGPGPDQAYALELARPARVRMRMQSEFDGLLSLRGRCAAAESELACSDDSASGQPLLNAELAAGSYTVIVDGAARNEGGDYVLQLEQAEIPPSQSAEQACAQAPRLEVDGRLHELDTFHASSSSSSSCGGAGAPDRAFRLRLAHAGTLTVHASDFEFDPVFSLRRACEYVESELLCVPLVRVSGPSTLSEERVVLQLSLPAGEYALLIDGQTPSSMGAGSVRLSFEPNAVLR